jgi:hypothetical protein
MDFHLFLSSLDSKAIHRANTAIDFTVELPQTVDLNGEWECALVDFQLVGSILPFDPFCLCSDICEQSCVGDERLPILRRLSAKGREQDSAYQFEQPQYILLKLNRINRIRIYITSTNHPKIADTSGVLTCTLHLRSKK